MTDLSTAVQVRAILGILKSPPMKPIRVHVIEVTQVSDNVPWFVIEVAE